MDVKRKVVPVAVLLGLAVWAAPAGAAVFTVTSANDGAAAGSLRWAINAAELQPGRDEIEFDIAGAGPHTIALAGDLPTISRPVTVDGYTEPGAQEATEDEPAEPMIAIDATNAFRGLDVGGNRITVRGLAIHSARTHGIFLEGRENIVAGNHIGTDSAGVAALPNADYGVEIFGTDNVVGGPGAADRNVIASNFAADVQVTSGSGHEIQGNRIGTNAAGTANLGVGFGVSIPASGNLVRDNLISGEGEAVQLSGDRNTLHGNLIGTDATGTSVLGNGVGVNVENADHNRIGGSGAGEGNVISGSSFEGILIENAQAVGNVVEGNLIGVDASGAVPLPNGDPGFGNALPAVAILNTNDNVVGGSGPGAGNVIAGNAGDGVQLSGDGADENRVAGNLIGTNAAGASLGNGGSGVEILAGDDNTVGAGNVIAHNGEDGVTVDETAVGNAITGDSIFANGDAPGDLGIDLGADGVTANDALDVDAGANALLNHPEITAVTAVPAGIKVHWTLDGLASTGFRLELFASEECDDSGSGEGATLLGSVDVVTDAAGHAAGTTLPAVGVAADAQISMTATRKALVGPLPVTVALRDTSELSPCQPVA